MNLLMRIGLFLAKLCETYGLLEMISYLKAKISCQFMAFHVASYASRVFRNLRLIRILEFLKIYILITLRHGVTPMEKVKVFK